jgi:drug/metabolite transporter (DMT)-like permease
MTLRQRFILAGVALFGSSGDVLLSRGMKQVGAISLHNFHELFSALLNPWVFCGIALLILFFVSYLTALSWADLTYVLPATATGYTIMALLAHYFLHEHVSLTRWLGILLITAGVGFVAGGPIITEHESQQEVLSEAQEAGS